MYTVVQCTVCSSKQYRGYKLGNTLVGQLWLIISGHVMEKFQFHYSVAYCAPVECNTRHLEKNYRLIFGE